MARTKETWTLNLNHDTNVFTRNGKVALMVTDPEDTSRQIFVQINCDALSVAANIESRYEHLEHAAKIQAKEKKIASLKAIIDGDFPLEMQEMAYNQLMELENV